MNADKKLETNSMPWFTIPENCLEGGLEVDVINTGTLPIWTAAT